MRTLAAPQQLRDADGAADLECSRKALQFEWAAALPMEPPNTVGQLRRLNLFDQAGPKKVGEIVGLWAQVNDHRFFFLHFYVFLYTFFFFFYFFFFFFHFFFLVSLLLRLLSCGTGSQF